MRAISSRVFSVFLPAIITLFFICVFFYPVIFSTDNLFINLDHSFQNIPFRNYAFSSVLNGEIPLWCPYSALGFPVFAEGQSGVAYFPNWLFYIILPFVSAYNLSLLAHLFASALFFYALMRLLKLTKIASLTGAVGWIFSTYFIRKLMFVNLIESIALIPLLLYFVIKSINFPAKKLWIFGGIVLALQVFAGHPQSVAFSLVLCSLFALFSPGKCKILHRIGILLKLTVFGVALSAWQWIPTLRLMLSSGRNPSSGFSGTDQMSLPPAFSPSLILNDIFGNAADGTFWGNWGAYEWEISGYISVVLVLLACLAPLKNQWVRFFWGIALFGFLMALGKYTIIYPSISKLPFFNSLRIPARWLLLLQFAVAALGAIGFSEFAARDRLYRLKCLKKYWIFIFPMLMCCIAVIGTILILNQTGDRVSGIWHSLLFSTGLAVVLGLLMYCSTKQGEEMIAAAGILCIVFLDLWHANAFYPGYAPSDTVMNPPKIFADINDQLSNRFRILSLMHEQAIDWNWHENWADSTHGDYKYFNQSLHMYSGMLFCSDIFTLNEWSPLHYSRYKSITAILSKKFLNRLGVKYILAPQRPLPFKFPLKEKGEMWDLFENDDALPKALIINGVPLRKIKPSIIQCLRSAKYNPSEIAFLESEETELRFDQNAEGSATITHYSPHEIALDVSMKTPGTLLVADAMDPGWIVSVNDRSESICTADYIFRAVQLPEGNHKVIFKYKPVDYLLGLFITGLSLLLMIVYLLQRQSTAISIVSGMVSNQDQ